MPGSEAKILVIPSKAAAKPSKLDLPGKSSGTNRAPDGKAELSSWLATERSPGCAVLPHPDPKHKLYESLEQQASKKWYCASLLKPQSGTRAGDSNVRQAVMGPHQPVPRTAHSAGGEGIFGESPGSCGLMEAGGIVPQLRDLGPGELLNVYLIARSYLLTV